MSLLQTCEACGSPDTSVYWDVSRLTGRQPLARPDQLASPRCDPCDTDRIGGDEALATRLENPIDREKAIRRGAICSARSCERTDSNGERRAPARALKIPYCSAAALLPGTQKERLRDPRPRSLMSRHNSASEGARRGQDVRPRRSYACLMSSAVGSKQALAIAKTTVCFMPVIDWCQTLGV